ncbi:MAG: hypothetical protein ACJ8D8_20630 [Microvirga sp.]|nr:hypothetical protein [Beijerinckiaceae bacterium]
METILALIDGFGDDPVVTLAVLGLVGGALAAYVVLGFARDRQGLRRRAAAGTDTPEPARAPGKPERPRSLERLVSFIDENIAGDTRQNRVLRRQLIQAGFFDPRAGAVYFAARLGFAALFGIELSGTGRSLRFSSRPSVLQRWHVCLKAIDLTAH